MQHSAVENQAEKSVRKKEQEGLYIRPEHPAKSTQTVRLGRQVFVSEYFWKHWQPRLGANASILIITLRALIVERVCGGSLDEAALCIDPDTGEPARQSISIRRDELCRLTGLSATTIHRLLAEPIVNIFVRSEQVRKKVNQGFLQAPNIYHVLMVDPPAPEDTVNQIDSTSTVQNEIQTGVQNDTRQIERDSAVYQSDMHNVERCIKNLNNVNVDNVRLSNKNERKEISECLQEQFGHIDFQRVNEMLKEQTGPAVYSLLKRAYFERSESGLALVVPNGLVKAKVEEHFKALQEMTDLTMGRRTPITIEVRDTPVREESEQVEKTPVPPPPAEVLTAERLAGILRAPNNVRL